MQRHLKTSRFFHLLPHLLPLAIAAVALLRPNPVRADDPPAFRGDGDRSRMELSFAGGFGESTEGAYAELAIDMRILAPSGFGAIVRTGAAMRWLSNALALDLGLAHRLPLVEGSFVGLDLSTAVGLSFAYGPFDPLGDVAAYGMFALAHLDLWASNFFIGIGVGAHALLAAEHDNGGRSDPILTVAPQLRFGGEWGL